MFAYNDFQGLYEWHYTLMENDMESALVKNRFKVGDYSFTEILFIFQNDINNNDRKGMIISNLWLNIEMD